MDIFSHIFALIILLFAAGYSEFIPFGVLGAVILDIDVVFKYFSDSHPSLYIFTHGGFTHSIFGAAIMSVIAFLVIVSLSMFGYIQEYLPAEVPLLVFFFILAGAFLHLFLDCLASPGIPFLYPLTEKKYGLGLFPIPIFMFFTLLSVTFLVLYLFHKLTVPMMDIFAAVFIGVVVVCACLRSYVRSKTNGRLFTTPNPFKWLAISENETSYFLQTYDVFHGVTGVLTFDKYRNITPSEIEHFETLPELRRHKYFSYITIAEREGSQVLFHDPLREQGIIPFPPWYASVRVRDEETTS
jgi:inner membrane protein